MYRHVRWIAGAGLLGLALAACSHDAIPETTGYKPKPVFCADGSDSLCGTIPSMVGKDPAISSSEGYAGLLNGVSSSDGDAQTPFDNMSWQTFVALNKRKGNGYAWQDFARVEEVFGPAPESPCPNPEGLPLYSLISKADGQPDREEEFLQAATGMPLIDLNGNWTLFERRLNDVERKYLKNDQWDLTTVAGQEAFVKAGRKVDFPAGADVIPPKGAPGAIEIKLAWRILKPENGDDLTRFLALDALLAVDASAVRGGAGPICKKVKLGLVGFHIIQKNPARGALLPQWIWASFEHQENAPLSPNACDPVNGGCYQGDNPPLCTAPAGAGTYSYFNPQCTAGGAPCRANEPPKLRGHEKDYLWSPQEPYAGDYLNDGRYGTQVARCWQIYSLTQKLNAQWSQKLAFSNSVLANYMLIGTQWGGNIEPRPEVFINGGVPAFLSNSTLETYIQTKPYGTCVGCHQNAKLAYKDGKTTYDANFSFLLSLADSDPDSN